MVNTSLRVLSLGVSSSELHDLIESFGSEVAVLCFETCGITRDRPEKRLQARHNRDYMRTLTNAGDVFGGVVYVRHPEATLEELDFLLNIEHYNPVRYHLAVELSLDFQRSDGTGKTVLPDRDRKLVEKVLELHRKTGISLDDFFDAYRSGASWEQVGHFFPEYPCREIFAEWTTGPRSLALELFMGLTVAAYAGSGSVITRQPYSFNHPTDGPVTSDVDVALVTSRKKAVATLSSLQREPGINLIIGSHVPTHPGDQSQQQQSTGTDTCSIKAA